MPITGVEIFKSRTLEQKRALVEDLTAGFVRAAGGTPGSVPVVISDVDKDDWGIGGALASDKFPD